MRGRRQSATPIGLDPAGIIRGVSIPPLGPLAACMAAAYRLPSVSVCQRLINPKLLFNMAFPATTVYPQSPGRGVDGSGWAQCGRP
jgi:hypothetical protein